MGRRATSLGQLTDVQRDDRRGRRHGGHTLVVTPRDEILPVALIGSGRVLSLRVLRKFKHRRHRIPERMPLLDLIRNGIEEDWFEAGSYTLLAVAPRRRSRPTEIRRCCCRFAHTFVFFAWSSVSDIRMAL